MFGTDGIGYRDAPSVMEPGKNYSKWEIYCLLQERGFQREYSCRSSSSELNRLVRKGVLLKVDAGLYSLPEVS
ncbi:MAG: hypothetical protein E7Z70_02160 [Thermoplasmata archaeon]|nr:hypothetical protein [Thermoplasmata archaeon]